MFGSRTQEAQTTKLEHAAIREPARSLSEHGCRVKYLPVNHAGQVDPASLAEVLAERGYRLSLGARDTQSIPDQFDPSRHMSHRFDALELDSTAAWVAAKR